MATSGPIFATHSLGDAKTYCSNTSTVSSERAHNIIIANELFSTRPYSVTRPDLAYVKRIVLVAGLTIVVVERCKTGLACSISAPGKSVFYDAHFEPSEIQAFFDKPSLIPFGGSRAGSIEFNSGENCVPEPRHLPIAVEFCEKLPDPTIDDESKESLVEESFIDAFVAEYGKLSLGDSLQGPFMACRSPTFENSVALGTAEIYSNSTEARADNAPPDHCDKGAPSSPISLCVVNGTQANTNTKVKQDSSSLQCVREGTPPSPPPSPSSITSRSQRDKDRRFLITWKCVVVVLAGLVCLNQVRRGLESKLFSDMIIPMKPFEIPAIRTSFSGTASSETLAQNTATSSLEWISSPSTTFAQTDALGFFVRSEPTRQSTSSEILSNFHINPTMESDRFSTAHLRTEIPHDCTEHFACRIFYQGKKSVYLGSLLAIALVYLGYLIGFRIVRVSQKLLNNIIEASLDGNTCEQVQNTVPGTLLDGVPSDESLRHALPLGCVFLTPSGPCTIDPRSIRQITLEEEGQAFGLPLEAPGSCGTPHTTSSLPSCFASVPRLGSPKGSLKVTFSEDHEVFILPPNTVTRDRNLRRRLSRRAMAAAGGNTVAPISKH